MKEASLVVYKQKKIPRIIQFLKKLFLKRPKQKEEVAIVQPKLNNEVDDFELLKKLIEGRINISEIDVDSKKRLVNICNGRLEGVRKQISDKKNEIRQMEGLLADVNAL